MPTSRVQISRDSAAPSVSDEPRRAAVIDVGSNSVRVVGYELDGRAMTPFMNEKVMAGLGRNLAKTGKLSPDGVAEATAALKRFRDILHEKGIKQIDAVATAAIREASDGPGFVRRVERETGLRLRVIDGFEEARLSALGVLAGEPDARGVVGDLGGSSLELTVVTPDGPGAGASFPLGPLALMDEKFDAERITKITDDALDGAPMVNNRGGVFYAVGGAWRALGRLDIALSQHPISVLHHYEMTRATTLKICEYARKQPKRVLEKIDDSAGKRADVLPYAAMVLDRVVRRGGFSHVIVSSFGLREGLLYEHLAPRARAEHPLVAGAAAFGAHHSAEARAFGVALEKWIGPLFEQLPPVFEASRDRVLRAAAARLADAGATLHSDQRHAQMFDWVVSGPFAAVSHAERAFLAAAVHHRYAKAPPLHAPAYDRLLDDDQRRAAAALGAAMRLAADISARTPSILNDFALGLVGGELALSFRASRAHLVTEAATKRLEPLANLLGVKYQIASGLRH